MFLIFTYKYILEYANLKCKISVLINLWLVGVIFLFSMSCKKKKRRKLKRPGVCNLFQGFGLSKSEVASSSSYNFTRENQNKF